jgi:hypothetical protein
MRETITASLLTQHNPTTGSQSASTHKGERCSKNSKAAGHGSSRRLCLVPTRAVFECSSKGHRWGIRTGVHAIGHPRSDRGSIHPRGRPQVAFLSRGTCASVWFSGNARDHFDVWCHHRIDESQVGDQACSGLDAATRVKATQIDNLKNSPETCKLPASFLCYALNDRKARSPSLLLMARSRRFVVGTPRPDALRL